VDGGRIAWAAGAYLAGSLPSTYLVARITRATAVIAASNRRASEADAHTLIHQHVGGAWAAVAAVMDVAKGFLFMLAADKLGHLPPTWIAVCGVLVVVGHSFPPYARAMAGRGLAGAAGVLLAVLPIPMVVTGVIILAGILLRNTGPATTMGFAAAPIVAAIQGQPHALVLMAWGILAVILLRRLEGVSAVAQRHGWPRAVVRRLIFDSDRPAVVPLVEGDTEADLA
jgi:acyl phosphate:glycerol-3-phosphate acyltransferase